MNKSLLDCLIKIVIYTYLYLPKVKIKDNMLEILLNKFHAKKIPEINQAF